MLKRRHLTTTLGSVLLAAALAAPGAAARPIDAGPRSEVRTSDLAPTVTRRIDDGIDLGSAAIGAGGATAVLMLAAAGTAAALRRGRHAT